MEELFSLSVKIHQFLVVGVFVVFLILAFLAFKNRDFKSEAKNYQKTFALLHTLVAALGFTGLLAWTIVKFNISHEVISMIVVFVAILYHGATLHILFRKTRIYDQETIDKFIKKTKILSLVSSGLLLFLTVLVIVI